MWEPLQRRKANAAEKLQGLSPLKRLPRAAIQSLGVPFLSAPVHPG